ncbi:hypothetical protein [Arvimicrobium flavum]|uniref:hypothetical protein n=1 Tax=Arvimicrobium flavum TaxID=3393320 RepID=UPI00237A7DF8|nr:hypothetical protein [Mesorhizobium shangrilense]
MLFLSGLARLAKARARRRTEMLLETLPPEVQKDIGWRWSPSRSGAKQRRSRSWEL